MISRWKAVCDESRTYGLGWGKIWRRISKDYLSAYTVSLKPVFSKEANDECEQWIKSKGYLLDINGSLLRDMSKDMILCAYNITKTNDKLDANCNVETPAYAI